MVDMSVKIGSVTLKNPIMPASGCFSTDLAQVIDLNRLGALVAKTVSREFRAGNPPPRVSEVEGGMINSIGLPTKGIDYFLSHQVPEYKRFSPPLVGSISATTIEDFEAMARDVSPSEIDVLEVNISCPTRDPKGGNFALHEEHTFNVMRRIRATTDKPIWCKLSPNAGDVVAIARAAEAAGADALVVSNTILGLKIDVNTFHPAIGNKFGGLSGPGIKPIIVRMVYQGGEDSDHRLRRHRQDRGRGRIHACRRQRGHDRLPYFPQSLGHHRDHRGFRRVVRQARFCPRRRPHRRHDRRSAARDLRRGRSADRVVTSRLARPAQRHQP
jgi:dihydroorotate dehydrogenase (NAD+) catalytic subunit